MLMRLRFTIIILLQFLIFSTINAQMLRDHMILNLPFDGQVKDYSGNDAESSIIDAALFTDRFGTAESAYYFDGIDDNIEIGNDTFYKPELPITFSMWVYPEDLSTVHNKLFATDDNPNFYSGIIVQLDHQGSGVVVVSFGTGNGSGSQHRRTAHGSLALVENEWQHIAGVIRGAQDFEIYVDGVKDEGITYSGTGGAMVYSDAPARIGAYDGNVNGDTRYFKGGLDDIKLWSEALSEEDILEIYNELIYDMPVIANALDYSGNMIDGNPMVAILTTDRFEEAESAYYFDGASSIEVPHNPMFKPQIPFSVSMWVNPEDLDHPDNVLFTNDDHPDFYSGISMRIDHLGAGTVSLSYGTGGGSGPNNRRTARGQIALQNNQWFHVVGICRGPQDMDIYINNVKDSLEYSGNGAALLYTEQPGRIGAFDGNAVGPIKYLIGKLDEFKMWNRVISEAEIDSLYTPGVTTGVREQKPALFSNIDIYPNPAFQSLNIDGGHQEAFESYRIFTNHGQLIQAGDFTGQVDVQQLDSGMYILKLSSKKQSMVKYFIKA